jgi:hypothetical protein
MRLCPNHLTDGSWAYGQYVCDGSSALPLALPSQEPSLPTHSSAVAAPPEVPMAARNPIGLFRDSTELNSTLDLNLNLTLAQLQPQSAELYPLYIHVE